MRPIKHQNGQTLIELVVALAVGILVVSALSIAILSSLSNAQSSRDQSLATSYAQEGLENIRRSRDQSWTMFSSLNGTYCIGEASPLPGPGNKTTTGCTAANIGSSFIRQAQIVPGAPSNTCEANSMSVSVQVRWNDGKCTGTSGDFCHAVELKSCMSNIYGVPTP